MYKTVHTSVHKYEDSFFLFFFLEKKNTFATYFIFCRFLLFESVWVVLLF